MNADQIKSGVRYLLAILGGALAGWATKAGWANSGDISALLSSEALVGIVTAVVMFVWGLWARTSANMIYSVAALPEVKSVSVLDSNIVKEAPDDPDTNVTKARGG